MPKIQFRKARPLDAFAIELDAEGAKELSYSPFPNPKAALAATIELFPTCLAAEDEGRNVIALAGIVFAEGSASPWLLLSERAKEHKFPLVKKAALSFKRMRALTPPSTFIYNYIGKESHEGRAFLKRLGFRFITLPDGPRDLFFLPHV